MCSTNAMLLWFPSQRQIISSYFHRTLLKRWNCIFTGCRQQESYRKPLNVIIMSGQKHGARPLMVSSVQLKALTGLNKTNTHSSKKKTLHKRDYKQEQKYEVSLQTPGKKPGQAEQLHYLKQHSSETVSLSLKLFLKTPPPYTPDFLVYLKFHHCFSTSSLYIFCMFMPGANFNIGFCFFCMVKECSHKQTLYTRSCQIGLVFISSFSNIPVTMTFRYICHIYYEFLTYIFHPKM